MAGGAVKVDITPFGALSARSMNAWRQLADQAAEPNPFFEADVVVPSAAQFVGGARAALLTVTDAENAIFALPVTRCRSAAGAPVSALATWHGPLGRLGTPLVRREHIHEAWSAVLNRMRHGPEEAWMVLDRSTVHGPVATALRDVLGERRADVKLTHLRGRPVLRRRLDGSWPVAAGQSNGRVSVDLAVTGATTDESTARAAVDGMLRLRTAEADGDRRRPPAGENEALGQVCSHFHKEGRLRLWRARGPDGATAYLCTVVTAGTSFHLCGVIGRPAHSAVPRVEMARLLVAEAGSDPLIRRLDASRTGSDLWSDVYAEREAAATMLVATRGIQGPLAVRTAQAIARLAPVASGLAGPVRRRMRSG